jgi:hypothetical protein
MAGLGLLRTMGTALAAQEFVLANGENVQGDIKVTAANMPALTQIEPTTPSMQATPQLRPTTELESLRQEARASASKLRAR